MDATNSRSTEKTLLPQVKPHSGHDPKILKGIFIGFLNRAYTICKGQHLEEEIQFLIKCFMENGYNEVELTKIESSYRQKRNEKQDNRNGQQQQDLRIVSLPWVPGLSPKLRKSFRKAGYKTVFKSSANLQTILTLKNKCQLPPLSQPGVYIIPYKCGKKYVGETKLRIATRFEQHKDTIIKEKWSASVVSFHSSSCNAGYDWDNAKMLKQEFNKFDRKVREALEIQFQGTSPRSEHGLNLDGGQYVTTKFWKPMFAYLKRKSLQ
ncbi:uncharacterized protein LOC130625256 [Hydractinia symbiolongicarpus]|uniref:uncharacterized protein LOC130625256 n=1 Tax=Hydractinia symbiolongicarpus TaxID=13093 RepID=UPI00254F625A|nr:uncharacterized protein LOC130625256 [Hydractinia symbiolongicarpus]